MSQRKLPPLVINGYFLGEPTTIIIYKLIDTAIAELMSKLDQTEDSQTKLAIYSEIDQYQSIKRIVDGTN